MPSVWYSAAAAAIPRGSAVSPVRFEVETREGRKERSVREQRESASAKGNLGSKCQGRKEKEDRAVVRRAQWKQQFEKKKKVDKEKVETRSKAEREREEQN